MFEVQISNGTDKGKGYKVAPKQTSIAKLVYSFQSEIGPEAWSQRVGFWADNGTLTVTWLPKIESHRAAFLAILESLDSGGLLVPGSWRTVTLSWVVKTMASNPLCARPDLRALLTSAIQSSNETEVDLTQKAIQEVRETKALAESEASE